uniref:CS domain-containing protein n=1 Tax=Anopheles maculatus TaxID=74869 RepID=A0A182SNF6_9DIPT
MVPLCVGDSVPPPAVWAQRSEVIFLTLNVECTEPEIKFTEDSLTFSGVGKPEGKKYELNVEFYSKINPDKVATKNIKRCIEFVIAKADPQAPYWPRLLKDKTKPHWLKVDFNRWEDEGSNDEEGGQPDMGDKNVDLSELLQSYGKTKEDFSFDDLSDEQE